MSTREKRVRLVLRLSGGAGLAISLVCLVDGLFGREALDGFALQVALYSFAISMPISGLSFLLGDPSLYELPKKPVWMAAISLLGGGLAIEGLLWMFHSMSSGAGCLYGLMAICASVVCIMLKPQTGRESDAHGNNDG